MATQITINKVDYANDANAGQTWTFEYKLYSSPTWITASTNRVVDANGNLAAPLSIPGLTNGELYYVRASNNCSSPVETFTQQIQL